VISSLWSSLDAVAAMVAEEVGVESIDLRSDLGPTLEHYYDFAHFTPTGASVVARLVADAILRDAEAAASRVRRRVVDVSDADAPPVSRNAGK